MNQCEVVTCIINKKKRYIKYVIVTKYNNEMESK
jgi:hypothetical protein